MDRSALKSFTHNAKDFLSVGKNDYKQWVFRYTFLELEKDLGVAGDITTRSLGLSDAKVKGVIKSSENGVVAGLEELKYFMIDSDPRFRPRVGSFELKLFKKDGDVVAAGETVAEISGRVSDVLAVERVCLNLLMRMSGVATYTKKFVDLVKACGCDTLITPTRKVLWGWLDKKACVLGGGGTHRLNLSDAILVKDNHIKALGGFVATAVKNLANSKPDTRFIEIEVESIEEASKAAESLHSFISQKTLNVPVCIMFDNMKVADILDALNLMKQKGYYDDILFEASGGINEDNLESYAKTGVDIISIGKLTMGCKGLDFGMEIA